MASSGAGTGDPVVVGRGQRSGPARSPLVVVEGGTRGESRVSRWAAARDR